MAESPEILFWMRHLTIGDAVNYEKIVKFRLYKRRINQLLFVCVVISTKASTREESNLSSAKISSKLPIVNVICSLQRMLHNRMRRRHSQTGEFLARLPTFDLLSPKHADNKPFHRCAVWVQQAPYTRMTHSSTRQRESQRRSIDKTDVFPQSFGRTQRGNNRPSCAYGGIHLCIVGILFRIFRQIGNQCDA
jgi:hypothetical protein